MIFCYFKCRPPPGVFFCLHTVLVFATFFRKKLCQKSVASYVCENGYYEWRFSTYLKHLDATIIGNVGFMQCMVTWMLLTEITPTLYCSAFVFLPIIPLKTACCLNEVGLQRFRNPELRISHSDLGLLV